MADRSGRALILNSRRGVTPQLWSNCGQLWSTVVNCGQASEGRRSWKRHGNPCLEGWDGFQPEAWSMSIAP